MGWQWVSPLVHPGSGLLPPLLEERLKWKSENSPSKFSEEVGRDLFGGDVSFFWWREAMVAGRTHIVESLREIRDVCPRHHLSSL
jgi:hypothetical protein